MASQRPTSGRTSASLERPSLAALGVPAYLRHMIRSSFLVTALLSAGLAVGPSGGQDSGDSRQLRHYVIYRTGEPLEIDGRLDERSWSAAPWSEEFVDILGGTAPSPELATRFKMLWDDGHLYIGAELEEPDLWATLTERDAVIFHDNDFEVFIDPDGDTHRYGELEINALGTIWDLMLEKPYRDGGTAVSAWDITGLRVGVELDGTLNNPDDRDGGWSVELSIPWRALATLRGGDGRSPNDGDLWRVNLSRVQWKLEVGPSGYTKLRDPESGEPLPEQNWVWSPQGAVNMHMPEMWGVVQFSRNRAGEGEASILAPPDLPTRWLLRQVYYAQKDHWSGTQRWARDLRALAPLRLPAGLAELVTLRIDGAGWIASATGASGTTWRIRHDGRIWRE